MDDSQYRHPGIDTTRISREKRRYSFLSIVSNNESLNRRNRSSVTHPFAVEISGLFAKLTVIVNFPKKLRYKSYFSFDVKSFV